MTTPLRIGLCCALIWGCGDDGSSDTDAGTDAGMETTTLDLRFVDPAGVRLADVNVAVDTAAGRSEGVSSADGLLAIELSAQPGDLITYTAALEEFTVISFVDVPLDATMIDVVLFPLEPPPEARVTFTITATGTGTGVDDMPRICGSLGASTGGSFSLCGEHDGAWSFLIPAAAIGDAVNVWLLNGGDVPIDFERVSIPVGETSVAVEFDGAFATSPDVRIATVDLPTGAGGPYATIPLPRHWPGWAWAADATTGQHWSISSDPEFDGSTGDIPVRFLVMPPPAGTTLRYGAGARTQTEELHTATFARYVADPGTIAPVLALPTLLSGDRLDSPFSIAAPTAIGSDALRLVLELRDDSDVVWQIETRRPTNLEVPELPSGYDGATWLPPAGTTGTLVVRSSTRLETGEVGGVDRDFFDAVSEPYPLTF